MSGDLICERDLEDAHILGTSCVLYFISSGPIVAAAVLARIIGRFLPCSMLTFVEGGLFWFGT